MKNPTDYGSRAENGFTTRRRFRFMMLIFKHRNAVATFFWWYYGEKLESEPK